MLIRILFSVYFCSTNVQNLRGVRRFFLTLDAHGSCANAEIWPHRSFVQSCGCGSAAIGIPWLKLLSPESRGRRLVHRITCKDLWGSWFPGNARSLPTVGGRSVRSTGTRRSGRFARRSRFLHGQPSTPGSTTRTAEGWRCRPMSRFTPAAIIRLDPQARHRVEVSRGGRRPG